MCLFDDIGIKQAKAKAKAKVEAKAKAKMKAKAEAEEEENALGLLRNVATTERQGFAIYLCNVFFAQRRGYNFPR